VEDNKPALQEGQYRFPYHWLPEIDRAGGFSVGRRLPWGMEYLTYMDRLATLAKEMGPRTILDVGCGDGRLADFMDGLGIYRGVDLSDSAIRLAKGLTGGKDFQAKDIEHVEGRYDLITLVEVLEHVPDQSVPAFLAALADRMEAGGRILISVPTSNRPVDKKHYRHYDASLLARQLGGAGLEIESQEYLFRIGPLSAWLGRLASNAYFTLNPSPLTRLIWRLHRKFAYGAGPDDGAHLIVKARKASGAGRQRTDF